MLSRALSFFALSSLCCYSLALTVDIHGKIQWNEHCMNITDLGRTKVILDDGQWYGSVIRDGSFVVPNVPTGTFILSVEAHDHSFDQLRVDVSERSDSKDPEILVRPYFFGTPLNDVPPVPTLPYPITLVARARHVYFVPRETFDVLGMFRNPLMIIMVLTAAMLFGMPYLMKNVDPEVLEEFQQRQAKVARIQSSLQDGDIRGSLSAMLPDGAPRAATSNQKPENAAPSSSKTRSSPSPQHQHRKNKKR